MTRHWLIAIVVGGIIIFSSPCIQATELVYTCQTQTRVGQEFSREFAALMKAPEGIQKLHILIREVVSPQWGSYIWVEVNDVVVYRSELRAREGDIKEAAKNGVLAVTEYLNKNIFFGNGIKSEGKEPAENNPETIE